MATRIQLRGDTSTNWSAVNPTLAEREFAIETDTGKYKIGDGESDWESLPYRGLNGTSGTSGTSGTGGSGIGGEIPGLALTAGIPTAVDLLTEPVTFNRPANSENTVDAIDTGITLKRPNNGQGWYNSYQNTETSWNSDISPSGTLWNVDGWGDLSDVQSREYTSFYEACDEAIGVNVVGREFVMHDTINDKYYKFEFLYWQPNGGGGSNQVVNGKSGLTYVRTLIDLSSVTEFTRPANDPTVMDLVGPGVTIARGENGGIYNDDVDAEWDPDNTPSGTLWNAEHKWKDFSDLTSLTWKPFYAAIHGQIGNNVLGKKLLMWDTVNDKYYTVKFTDWGQNNGGSFAYIRREVLPQTGITNGIRFADGSFQETAQTTGDLIIKGNAISNQAFPTEGLEFVSPTNEHSRYFSSGNWSGLAEWVTSGSQGRIDLNVQGTEYANLYYFLGNGLGAYSNVFVSINGGDRVEVVGWGTAGINTKTPPPTNPTTVNNLQFFLNYTNTVYINSGGAQFDLAQYDSDFSANCSSLYLNSVSNLSVFCRNKGLFVNSDGDVFITGSRDLQIRNTSSENSIDIITQYGAGQDERSWQFNPNGTIGFPNQSSNNRTGSGYTLKFSNQTNQYIIASPAGVVENPTVERLVIAGGDSYLDPDTSEWIGEGGDIYLWAGFGANGGDIKVDAGHGVTYGGTVKVRAGDAQDDINSGNNGGFTEITGGSGYDGGAVNLYGGNGVNIGGSININAGFGDVTAGNVNVMSDNNTWTFDSAGNLTLPANGDILDSNGTSVLGGAVNTGTITFDGVGIIGSGTSGAGGLGTIELIPDFSAAPINAGTGYGTGGRYLIIDPTSPDHIHIRAGGPIDEAAAKLILGGEKANVIVQDQDNSYAESHQVMVNTQSNTGDTYEWVFGSNGELQFPDQTTQSTAWAGGRVVSAPGGSEGSSGDLQGDMAFTSGYIYYCVDDYVSHDSPITIDSGGAWGGYAGGLTSLPFYSPARVPQVGWSLSGPQIDPPGYIAGIIITSVTSLGDDRYTLGFTNTVMNISTGFLWTLTDDTPPADIWKRVAWSNDTW